MADHLEPRPSPGPRIGPMPLGPEWGMSLRPRPAVHLHAARAPWWMRWGAILFAALVRRRLPETE